MRHSKARERFTNYTDHRWAKRQDETRWKLDCSLSRAVARCEMHPAAVACENRVGVRQCTSISPPALQFRYREWFNREICFVHTYIETRAYNTHVERVYAWPDETRTRSFSYRMNTLFLKDNLCLSLSIYTPQSVLCKMHLFLENVAISPSLKRIEIPQIYSRYISLYSVSLIPSSFHSYVLFYKHLASQKNTNEKKVEAFAFWNLIPRNYNSPPPIFNIKSLYLNKA